MLVTSLTVNLLGQDPLYSPLGSGVVNRYFFNAPHANKKGVTLLLGNWSRTNQRVSAELTWTWMGSKGEPLDEEPINISIDPTSIYWENISVQINPTDTNRFDKMRITSGLLDHGNSYKVHGQEWGPWRKYLFISDNSGVMLLMVSATRGIIEWTDYMNLSSYTKNNYIRKFTVLGTTKKRLELTSIQEKPSSKSYS